MEVFTKYLTGIENCEHRKRMETILNWVTLQFPNLQPKVAWNQPMFTDHGTFIIGFSTAKNHLSIAPEQVVVQRFSGEIAVAGYEFSKQLIRIKWSDSVDYPLLKRIIQFNIKEKADCPTFWRS